MEDAKTKARIALTRRINDFKPDENICEVIKDTIDEIWAIFEDDYYTIVKEITGDEIDGKETHDKKGKNNFKRGRGARQAIDSQAEKVLRSNSGGTTPKAWPIKVVIKGTIC